MTFDLTRDADGVIVVSVTGQLTVTNRQELKDLVIERLESGDLRVVIDLGATSYIDSSGLGVLVSLAKRVRDAGGDLRLCNLGDDLAMLFELTKLDTLFAIFPSRAAALTP